MPRAKKVLSTALALALLAGLCWSGREAGKLMARAGWFQQGTAAREAVIPGPRHATRPDGDPRAAAKALRRLRFLSEGSVFLHTDWETLAEIRTILAGLSSEELAEVFDGLEKEILAYSGLHLLAREVLAAWITLDPTAALLAANRTPRFGAESLVTGWAMDDPAGALGWLDGGEFPAELADKRNEFRAAALHGIFERDFDLATTEFLKLEPGGDRWLGRDGVMSSWASRALQDPALREQLVAFAKTTGRPEDHARMNESLLRDWPQEDALGMLTYINDLREYQESAAIPADKRPEMDATAVGVAIYREYDRPALEWWMERYADSPQVPGPLQDAMSQWQQKYPDKVSQWFAEQPASPQRDALQASLVPSLIASGKMEDAAQVIGNIADPAIRQPALERLDYVWSRKDADAAAEWRAGLSEAEGSR